MSFTNELYFNAGSKEIKLRSGETRNAAVWQAKVPIIDAVNGGREFIVTGQAANPFFEGEVGQTQVLNFDTRWCTLTASDLQMIVAATPEGERTAVRVIDTYGGGRRLVPQDEAAVLFHLGATPEGMEVAKSLGFDANARQVTDSDGSSDIFRAEVAISCKALAALAIGPVGVINAVARQKEMNPSLQVALQIVQATGALPARNPVERAPRQVAINPDDAFTKALMGY